MGWQSTEIPVIRSPSDAIKYARPGQMDELHGAANSPKPPNPWGQLDTGGEVTTSPIDDTRPRIPPPNLQHAGLQTRATMSGKRGRTFQSNYTTSNTQLTHINISDNNKHISFTRSLLIKLKITIQKNLLRLTQCSVRHNHTHLEFS
jgi:hypothetical protein